MITTLVTFFTVLCRRNKKIVSQLIMAFVVTLLSIIANLSLPLLLKKVISSLTLGVTFTPVYLLKYLLLSYGIIWVASNLLNELRLYILFKTLEESFHTLNILIFEHLQLLSMGFHVNRKTGDLTSMTEKTRNGLNAVFLGTLFFYDSDFF